MSFEFAWLSCVYPASPTPALDHIRSHDVRFLHLQGDTPYMWLTANVHGVNAPAITKSSLAADFELHHLQQRQAPNWKELHEWAAANNRPIYFIPDDHEWGGDNWDHTINQANAASFNLNCTTQDEVNFHWWEGMKASMSYMTDNVPNTDSEAVLGDIPSQALVGDTPPASNYPITYFRVGYDLHGNVSSNPHIEFFVIDCISYRSPLTATDNASKTMLGAAQKAWLKARVVASTATFKVILSNKKLTASQSSDNSDIWHHYSTERNEILAHFDGSGVTAAPWLVGDRHVPNVAQLLKANGDSADVLCVCACPTGVDNNSGTRMSHTRSHVWIGEFTQKWINVYGIGKVEQDRITLQLRDAVDDSVRWQGYIQSGSNIVQYERTRIG